MFLLVAIAVIFLKVRRKSTNPYHKHPTDDAKPNIQNVLNHYDSLNRPGGMNIYFSLEPKKQESHYEDINITMWDHIYTITICYVTEVQTLILTLVTYFNYIIG